MGSSSSKIQLAVFHEKNMVRPLQYIQEFANDKNLIIHQYQDFNQFIEKQSLKKISNILILQTDAKDKLKQVIKVIEKKKILEKEYKKKQKDEKKIHPAFEDLNNYIGASGIKIQFSIRKSLIEYIKKYSLQYLNLYIWSQNVTAVDVALSQMCYISLISNNLRRIKEHIQQQQRSKIINSKFKRLVKDLYRKVQVALICSDKKQHQNQKEKKIYQSKIKNMKDQFKKRGISWQIFTNIDQYSQKTTSLYAQFIICFHQQDILQLVQRLKNLNIDSKIIYFGTKVELSSNQKKLLGTWLTLDDLCSLQNNQYITNQQCCMQLCEVIKKCSHISAQNETKKNSTQVIIYFQQLYNIKKLNETKNQILDILRKKKGAKQNKNNHNNIQQGKRHKEQSKQQEKQQQQKQKQKQKQQSEFLNQIDLEKILFQFGNIQDLYPKIQKQPYTIIILFDSTPKKLQRFKTKLRKQNFSQRVQITMLQLKQFKQNQKLSIQEKKQTMRKKYIQCLIGKQLKSYFNLKFQIGPIQTINFLNPDQKFQQYFQNKLGLKTNIVKTSQNQLQSYKGFSKSQNAVKIFQDFHLIAKVKDYQQYLQPIFQDKNMIQQQMLSQLKVIIYDKKQNIADFFQKNGQKLLKTHKNQQPNNKLKNNQKNLQSGSKNISNQNNQGSSLKKLPKNVVLVHYIFQKIQEYLMYVQVPKISMAFFRKGVLRELYEINNKTLAIINSRSFVLQGTFVSNNQLLKSVFQQNKVKTNSEFQMLLIKFPIVSRMNDYQIHLFQDYIRKYAKLWMIGYSLLDQMQIIEQEKQSSKKLINFFVLKQDIKKCFYKCRTYQLLKVTDQQFKYFYIDRMDKCQTLLDLQITCIYIYSLPHGFSQIINSIFKQPLETSLSIKVFCSYLLVLFLNFYSIQKQQMEKFQISIYLKDKNVKEIYQNIKQGDIIFNRNFLPCCKNETQNSNVHKIVIQIQSFPFLQRTPIKNLFYIERFSFYKQSAEYLMAPFTKLRLKRKFKNGDNFNLIFQIPSNQNNIFISQIFKINKVNFQDYSSLMEGEVENKLSKKKINNKKSKENKQKYSKNTSQTGRNTPQNESIYQNSQAIAILQEKNVLQISINNAASHRQFIRLMQKQLYCSATIQLTKIIKMNQKKKKVNSQQISTQSIQANLQANLLKIQKAALQFKTGQYKNSLRLLQQVIQFLKEEKIQGYDNWIQKKIEMLKFSVQNTFKYQKQIVDQSKKINLWNINMNQTEEQQGKLVKKKIKWSVTFQQTRQLFLLTPSQQDIYVPQLQIKKNSSFQIVGPQSQFGQFQYIKDQNKSKNYNTNSILSSKHISKRQLNKQNKKQKLGIIANILLPYLKSINYFASQQNHQQKIIISPSKPQNNSQNIQHQQTEILRKIIQLQETETLLQRSINLRKSQKIEWQIFEFEGKMRLVKKHKKFKVSAEMLKHHVWKYQSKKQ